MAKIPKITKAEARRRVATAPRVGDEKIAETSAVSETKQAASEPKTSAAASVHKARSKRPTGKKGVGKLGAAAIAGGVLAAGAAATAAILSRRGSTPAPGKMKSKTAHQPDGTDSSASFEARIADESTIPDPA